MSRKNYPVIIKVKYFSCFLINLFFISCQLQISDDEIEIHLPELKSEYHSISDYFWEIQFIDSEGLLQIIEVKPGSDTIPVSAEKGVCRAYTVRTVFLVGSTQEYKTLPAGFLYPFDKVSGRRAEFSWKRGFECELIQNISRYLEPDKLNISRLIELVETVAGNDNHWILDGERIYEQIISGDFRSYDVRKRRERQVGLLLPEGLWLSESVLGANIFSLSESAETEVLLPAGRSRFIHSRGLLLDIFIESDGSCEYIVY